ncbi:hypothetical protein FHR99_002806 [Litorivivens lipolytica]|uniref:PepSY-associated TM region n=1 Tax=Litorivivens lipolytica TaxID=1524264 RepID=A0A7W4W6U6_9GAMM|nr:PepSY domain-containing protein [Litorivivens lipolytica]MBB3048532.1 hypothetical protein [Litorivivens lipolytica]
MTTKTFMQWHRRLAWIGGIAILCWAVSGVLHPLMAWFGPQGAKMFPPSATVPDNALRQVAEIVASNVFAEARVVKVVPSANGAMLQVAESEDKPRRYFALDSGSELAGQDERQARWLAAYYTGRDQGDIADIQFQTEFNSEYPSVNRLLPVYRVTFAGDDQLTAFIHTETPALASLNNRTKAAMQSVFVQLHTWAWLDAFGAGRVLLIALFMVNLFLLAGAGLGLVLLLPSRKVPDGKRRWHRLLGYGIWLPLLAWSLSGFYHLIQSEYVEPESGLSLGQPMVFQGDAGIQNTASAIGKPVTAIALVPTESGWRYRVELPAQAEAVDREARFAGRAQSGGSQYLDAQGEAIELDDATYARWLANQFKPGAEIDSVTPVYRFGPSYDFRNKRLPVWQVTLNDDEATELFVDPASGVLVDQSRRIDRIERLSFALLHKWNFLTGLTGRQGRDALIVVTLLISIGMTVLGFMMLLRHRAR